MDHGNDTAVQMRIRSSVLLSISILTLQHVPLSNAAHPARRRVVESGPGRNAKYDRSITTFSEDGKLLQVEYGIEASNRGSTVACLRWNSPETNNKASAIVIALALDNDDANAAARKVHRLDAHCLLVATGLAGDGRALADEARVDCQRFRLRNGETPTVSEIAESVANRQHALTTMAGARPFGVTATVVGVDEGGAARLFRSEPGGVVDEYVACAAGRCRRQAERELVRALETISGDDATALSDAVRLTANAVFEADRSCQSVDLWVIESSSATEEEEENGAIMRIRFAKRVRRDDLQKVKRIFGGAET